MAQNLNKERELELEWIKAAKQDPDKFAPLYDKYFKQIYLFVFKRTGNKALAGDLTAQAFLKAMLNIKKYEDQGYPFSAWLYRIAANEVNMHYRKTKKHITVQVEERDVITLMDEVSPDGGEEQSRRERLLIEALNHLDDSKTKMIELRYFEKLSFRELGAVFNISEGNAKVRTYRILDEIKEFVQKHKDK